MPGTPVLQQLEARIAEMGGEDTVIFDRIADGEKVKTVMSDLGSSRGLYWTWLKRGGEERKAKHQAALRASAAAVYEDGGAILDELADKPTSEITPALVALSGKRADWRKHMAQVRDPETYGDRSSGITVNIGTLHLDALRAVGSMTKPELAPIEDALLITDGEDAD